MTLRSIIPRPKTSRGFTIIELLAVMVIIAALASIAIIKFGQSKRRGYLAAMRADLHTLALAAESRYATEGSYEDLDTPQGSAGVHLVYEATLTSWKGTATHDGVPGMSCTIESLPGADAMRPEPVCH